jgi:hypothetical protein
MLPDVPNSGYCGLFNGIATDNPSRQGILEDAYNIYHDSLLSNRQRLYRRRKRDHFSQVPTNKPSGRHALLFSATQTVGHTRTTSHTQVRRWQNLQRSEARPQTASNRVHRWTHARRLTCKRHTRSKQSIAIRTATKQRTSRQGTGTHEKMAAGAQHPATCWDSTPT